MDIPVGLLLDLIAVQQIKEEAQSRSGLLGTKRGSFSGYFLISEVILWQQMCRFV